MDSTTPLRIDLPCGTLTLEIEHATLPLNNLCGFASRRSRKRGFVFVSKVLGKHYPVQPSRMAEMHTLLAQSLLDTSGHNPLPGPILVIALAETATGLGQGVFERYLRRSQRTDALFTHTTRYLLNHPLALRFEESHSHATRHLVYLPARPQDQELFHSARTLVLIDDEMSTGQTLTNLARAYHQLQPNLQSVHLVCLTDWMGPVRRAHLQENIGVPVRLHRLLAGTYTFEDCPSFDPGPIPAVVGRGDHKDHLLRGPTARLGIRTIEQVDVPSHIPQELQPPARLLVLGTGEFTHLPFRLALALEELGFDVTFQSTTRSPLLVGGALSSVLEFRDNYHDDIPNYLYNVANPSYDRILIGYETHPIPEGHDLPRRLGAQVILF